MTTPDLPGPALDGPAPTPTSADRRSATIFAVDCDRTLTGPDLVPDADALAAIARLRTAGIVCILVTGRTQQELASHPAVATAFDAYVLEGGATWGPWDQQWKTGNANLVLDAAQRVQAAGIPILQGTASFSCARADLDRAQPLLGECSVNPNVDRVDILPPGIDKGMGLEAVLGRMGLRGAQVIAIGDGENDIPFLGRATVGLAVANAHAALKEAADETLDGDGPKGLVQAAHRVLQGEWVGAGRIQA